jgi:hypothetical protein
MSSAKSIRRASAPIVLAIFVVTLLTACLQPMTRDSIDTDAIAEAITATSDSIDSTAVETSIDGLTTHLYVRPVVGPEGLTSDELDAVLRVAYEETRGRVSAIEIRTVDQNEEPIDLTVAASGLGITHMDNIHSVTYSTEYLDDAYGE